MTNNEKLHAWACLNCGGYEGPAPAYPEQRAGLILEDLKHLTDQMCKPHSIQFFEEYEPLMRFSHGIGDIEISRNGDVNDERKSQFTFRIRTDEGYDYMDEQDPMAVTAIDALGVASELLDELASSGDDLDDGEYLSPVSSAIELALDDANWDLSDFLDGRQINHESLVFIAENANEQAEENDIPLDSEITHLDVLAHIDPIGKYDYFPKKSRKPKGPSF